MTSRLPARLIEGGALFLLAFSPLAFGTVEPWSEAVAELVILGMAVSFVIGSLRNWELRLELPPGWLPALGFLVLIVLQGAIPGWSADPHATRRETVKLFALAAFFVVCWNSYRTRVQAERVLWTMTGVGAFIAVFGILQRMTWNGRMYWIGPEIRGASAFGSYVNRAHFAGLMVVVVPAALVFMLASRRPAAPTRRPLVRTWRDRLREWNSSESTGRALIPSLILVMGGAALVSGSRGGVVALLAALLAMILGSLVHRRSWSGLASRVSLATVLILLAGVWIGGDIVYGTAERLATEVGQPDESFRLHIWSDALQLWRSAPALGTGLGSFDVAFPGVRTLALPVAVAHAESDWLQFLTDTGVVGLVLALLTAGTLLTALLRRVRQGPSPRARSLALAGLVALIGTVVQGIANYNLPVMANWLYLAVALALVRTRSEPAGERAAIKWGASVAVAEPGAPDGGRIAVEPHRPPVASVATASRPAKQPSVATAVITEEPLISQEPAPDGDGRGGDISPLEWTGPGVETAQSAPRFQSGSAVVPVALLAGDLLALAFCAVFAVELRAAWWGSMPTPYPLGLLESAVAWGLLRLLVGLYPGYGLTPPAELRLSTVTTAVAAMGHVTALFLMKETEDVSRLIAFLTWSLLVGVSWTVRALVKEWLIRARLFGEPVVVAGAGPAGALVVRELRANPGIGFVPVAVFDDEPDRWAMAPAGVPVMGPVSAALDARLPHSVRHAIVAMPGLGGRRLVALAQSLGTRYRTVSVVPDLFGLANLWLRPRPLGACLTLEIRNNLLRPSNILLKRALDLVLAIPLGLAALPVVLVAVAAVKLASPGPAFFGQKREGLDGKRIRVWKIRTMYADAEARLEEHLRDPATRAEWSRYMKLRHDPRIVPVVGPFLRRFSIDELPQLWNVVVGEMSLVGPRPFPDYHLVRFSQDFRTLRRRAPSGITGLWQVTRRSEGDLRFQEDGDTYYIRNWSPWLDLWILLRTLRVVLGGRGSY